jgi:hypothetical protein
LPDVAARKRERESGGGFGVTKVFLPFCGGCKYVKAGGESGGKEGENLLIIECTHRDKKYRREEKGGEKGGGRKLFLSNEGLVFFGEVPVSSGHLQLGERKTRELREKRSKCPPLPGGGGGDGDGVGGGRRESLVVGDVASRPRRGGGKQKVAITTSTSAKLRGQKKPAPLKQTRIRIRKKVADDISRYIRLSLGAVRYNDLCPYPENRGNNNASHHNARKGGKKDGRN